MSLPPTQDMFLPPNCRAQIRNCLVNAFSWDDLKDLAFDMGVPTQSFPQDTLNNYARELIHWHERRELLYYLCESMLTRRPRGCDDLEQCLDELAGNRTRTVIHQSVFHFPSDAPSFSTMSAEELRDYLRVWSQRESFLDDLTILGVSDNPPQIIFVARVDDPRYSPRTYSNQGDPDIVKSEGGWPIGRNSISRSEALQAGFKLF